MNLEGTPRVADWVGACSEDERMLRWLWLPWSFCLLLAIVLLASPLWMPFFLSPYFARKIDAAILRSIDRAVCVAMYKALHREITAQMQHNTDSVESQVYEAIRDKLQKSQACEHLSP